jgi:AraC-like DNA-binding protein
MPTTGIETVFIKIQKRIYLLSRLTFLIQVIAFLILGSKLVKKYNLRIANFYSNLENRTIIWVKMLLISFIATSIISIGFSIIGREVFFDSSFLLVIPSAIFSALLFFIGFQGHLQNYTVVNLIEDENQHPEFNFKNTNQKFLKEKLLRLFKEDAIYRNSDLKMTQVSILLQTNRTYISNLINSEFSCSFSEFVNRYRIKEAKNILTNFSYEKFSLSHISDEVGFGSLHTFIRVFKEQEGMPPGKYRQKLLQKNRASLFPISE